MADTVISPYSNSVECFIYRIKSVQGSSRKWGGGESRASSEDRVYLSWQDV